MAAIEVRHVRLQRLYSSDRFLSELGAIFLDHNVKLFDGETMGQLEQRRSIYRLRRRLLTI